MVPGPHNMEEWVASHGSRWMDVMREHAVDVWICPAAVGPAPEGIDSTGDPAMNLPWTFAGLPAATVPAGTARNGLPLGLQCVSRFGNDSWLAAFANQVSQGARLSAPEPTSDEKRHPLPARRPHCRLCCRATRARRRPGQALRRKLGLPRRSSDPAVVSATPSSASSSTGASTPSPRGAPEEPTRSGTGTT